MGKPHPAIHHLQYGKIRRLLERWEERLEFSEHLVTISVMGHETQLSCYLANQVREHCLSLLEKALEENVQCCGRGVECGRGAERAIEEEYSMFCSTKTVQVYKLSIHKKVSITHTCAHTMHSRAHTHTHTHTHAHVDTHDAHTRACTHPHTHTHTQDDSYHEHLSSRFLR